MRLYIKKQVSSLERWFLGVMFGSELRDVLSRMLREGVYITTTAPPTEPETREGEQQYARIRG